MTEKEFENQVMATLPDAIFAHDKLMGTFFGITKEETTCISYNPTYELWFVGHNYYFPQKNLPGSTLEKALENVK